MPEHDIDAVLAAASRGSDVTIPTGWGQGRATFGGIVGGVLASHAISAVHADEANVRALTVNFVGPLAPGAARVTTEVLRQGKSATQLESRILQSDDDGVESVRAVGLMTIGSPRQSAVAIESHSVRHEIASPEGLEAIPFVKGLMPDFIAGVDMRLGYGKGPFSGDSHADMSGYMRFREPTARMSLPHLITLIDCWPPAPAQVMKGVANVSSMTWTMEFIAPADVTPEGFWRYDVTTDAAHDGYGHSDARISTLDGRLICISRQTIALFG